MTDRKVETIPLQGNTQYAKVSTRLKEFLEDNTESRIDNSYEFKDGWCIFSASVTSKHGVFTGHSMGKVGKLKAFEKLETIAVGRALAFAGYLASGEIASFEEMQTAGQRESVPDGFLDVDADAPSLERRLRDAKSLEELESISPEIADDDLEMCSLYRECHAAFEAPENSGELF